MTETSKSQKENQPVNQPASFGSSKGAGFLSMRAKILILTFLAGTVALLASGSISFGQEIPAQIEAQLPPGAVQFNPAGLSFTNVNYKVAAGTEMLSGSTGGTLTYAQGDIDAFHFRSFDVGFGTETTFSASGSGLHSAAVDLEGIKNLTNWQLVGKAGYGRNFEDNVGNFLKLGFDVNYNLTRGSGLSFLGSAGGAFTYAGAGVSWSTKNFSLNNSQNDIEKSFRIYVGYAF